MKKIIFISDGYGEDTIASYIVKSLKNKIDNIQIDAFPLVGTGRAYKGSGADITGPVIDLPSGGDIHSLNRLFGDIKGGLISLLFKQIFFLRSRKSSISVAVATGDMYPVILSALGGIRTVIFVGTAKSNWYYPYSFIEKFIMRQFCKIVFVRDKATADDLTLFGINSIYPGNTMMDCFTISGESFSISPDYTVIGILPGSRDVAYNDFPVILDGVEEIFHSFPGKVAFISAPPSSINMNKLFTSSSEWFFQPSENIGNGITGYLKKGDITVIFTSDRFGDVLNRSHIIIGQAGTGNEQAAGLGKPVVAFDRNINKMGWYRDRQKGLLGDALSVVKAEGKAIASEVLSILNNKDKRNYMSEIGRERMGGTGAIEHIADSILFESEHS